MTLLSVNVNKIAVLRNSRGGLLPSPLAAAELCISAGARGITVHPRPDRRHITAEDVGAIAAALPAHIEFNIEGNPFAPPRAGYPGLLALAASAKPAQVTFVPDGDGQITSDHGVSPEGDLSGLAAHIAAFKAIGCRVSLFVDPGETRFEAFRQFGTDRIEIYTGPFAEAFDAGDARHALRDCARTATAAQALGMGVNAGHDLSQANLRAFLEGVPGVLEVSIGHALISEALIDGLEETVGRYRAITGA